MTFSIESKTHLLFDLDGTLVDSATDIAVALNQALNTLELPGATEAQCREWIGGGVPVLIERASRALGIDEQRREGLTEVFLQHYAEANGQHSRCYPGVEETLADLDRCAWRMAVVTNKPTALAEALLKLRDIGQFFPLVIGGDTLPVKKPDPAPLQHACNQLDVSAAQCLMIGDSRADAGAAHAAGIDFIWTGYGYHRDDDEQSLKPAATLHSFPTLKELLQC